MPSNKPAALLLGLAALILSSTPPVAGQEFKIADVNALTGLAVDQLKPKTVIFLDRPADELIDPDAGLMRFEDWAQTKPVQKQFLAPYPSYVEPMVDVTIDGVRKRFREKQHMYVAVARYAIDRAPETLDLASLVKLPFIERIDPVIKHRLITSAEAVSPKDPRAIHNQHPLRRRCEVRPAAICIHSGYAFEGKLPLGIRIANKIRESSKPIYETLEFESELTLLSPEEVTGMGLSTLTGLDTAPIGALEQTIFYVNQVMQFGKLLAVFQQHPSDLKQTIVTVFMALGVESSLLSKKKEYSKVPVLRNLVPAQVLAGKSSFNTGNSISAGLPVYARNQVKAIAAILEEK